jgi:thiopeptide-type bacteriocin biosynthesis protein
MPRAASFDRAASTFFVLRTPLLPFETFASLGEGLVAARGGGEFGERLLEEETLVAARLRALVERPEIREALFLASPSFDRALSSWLADPARPADDDVALTLVRYLARMAARPTPFGLFAGCSFVRTGAESTRLALGPFSQYRKHTRLDTGYLGLLAEGFERDSSLRAALRFRQSTGLYEAADKLRYAERVTKAESHARSYELVAVERTPHLDVTLARARGGATPGELVDALVADDPEIERDDASAYVESLIASQILCSEVTPNLTGPEPLGGLIDTLRAAGTPAEQAARALEEARDAMRALDEAPLGLAPERYRAAANGLAVLPAAIDAQHLFHVDLYKPAPHATLGGAAFQRIEEAIELATRIAVPVPDDGMRRFRAAFAERYGERTDGPLATRRMVPLCEALDDETGLGFGAAPDEGSGRSPLLAGLVFPTDVAQAKPEFGRREERLLGGLVETLRAGRVEWTLSDADLAALAPETPATLPAAFVFSGTLTAPSAEALASAEVGVYVDIVAGPSGAVLLGRFCHGDPELHAAVEEHLRAEEALRPDAVFAEIVHLPEGMLGNGNVLMRPMLRGYEIPYLGRSGAPEERQIPITDLYLIEEERHLILFSKRLGREVIPRLTSAHNYPRSRLAIYRFLCGLQRERDRYAYGWNWGSLDSSPFLPRVSRGNIVLSLARWSLGKDELAPLARASHRERFRLVQELRQRQRLPRWVVLADGDRTLPVDLDNALSVASLAGLIARREGAVLTELYPSPDELVAEGPEGRFAHQIIVPFVRAPAPARAASAAASTPATEAPARRTFAPGSEWLYFKFYAGPASADAVLTDLILPAVARARRAKTLSGWFFVRSAEPHWHVGLALRGDAARLARLLPRLNQAAAPFLADGRLLRIAVDTYEREIERYGGEAGVELAESLFEADSDAALAILTRLESKSGADERWRLSLRGCHELLEDFGLELAARSDVIERARTTLGAALRVDTALERRLGARFREERAALDALLVAKAASEHPLAPGLAVLEERSPRVRAIVEQLRACERAGRLSVPLRELVPGFLRMHCNRLLRSDLRAQELVIYDFLQRLYVSEAARGRSPASPAGTGFS